MESYIKIKSSTKRMNEEFNNSNSPYYYIKSFNSCVNYKENTEEDIIFECLIRHNEIGKGKVERTAPYTFETLEKTLAKLCKEYDAEQNKIKIKNREMER